MSEIEFDYKDYLVKATYQYDVRKDGRYMGDINYQVFNTQGEEITYDLEGKEAFDIHQEIVDKVNEKARGYK